MDVFVLTADKNENASPSFATLDSSNSSALSLPAAAVENQSETCFFQLASKPLECNGKLRDDPNSSQSQSTDAMPDSSNKPDVHGNSIAEPTDGSDKNSSLLRHWQLKYPDRKIEPHSCATCGKQFLQAVQLRKHMIKHADDSSAEFPYTCCICRRHFLFANDLRRHLISHSDDRPHACVVCSRPFKREDDLAKHMKTHGDVRPYECDECCDRLESASKLRRHMRKVHGDRFECTRCRVFFAKRSLLSRHHREQHAGFLRNSVYPPS